MPRRVENGIPGKKPRASPKWGAQPSGGGLVEREPGGPARAEYKSRFMVPVVTRKRVGAWCGQFCQFYFPGASASRIRSLIVGVRNTCMSL
jgi:hypothetical protein